MTRTDEWKTVTDHILCKCKCKFGGRKCNSNQKWNNECWLECTKEENIICAKKVLLGMLLHVLVKLYKLRKYYWWFSNNVWWNFIANENYTIKF